MPKITVQLEDRSYPIVIENGLLDAVGARCASLGFVGQAVVVTNPVVSALCAKRVMASLKRTGFAPFIITLPDGERYKTLKTVSSVYDALVKRRVERRTPIIALGGGVIGDMAGFVAATYLRGVPYIQVPTTLLSQVDSSVGGKTGVNHPNGKNLIGAFYQPRAVFIDPETLDTLSEREFKAGLAEVIKYGVISDERFFNFLEKNAKTLAQRGLPLVKAIKRSCEIKAAVVASDERESGLRAILNFGHTFGHAIEATAGYGRIKHGEAVSIGMLLAARFSFKRGLCGAEAPERLEKLLLALGMKTHIPRLPVPALMRAMTLDKKVSAGRLRFVLTRGIGRVEVLQADAGEVEAFLRVITVNRGREP
ncbi:MAG: 3-dehydroquinate synthase [Deltaproteobacteria bacterium]|nr:3-dehydroquinate synthase [Deltaproteobacteria bacterium]